MSKYIDSVSRSIYDDILLNINNYKYMESLMTMMGANHQIFKKQMTITHLCIYSDDIKIIKLVLDSGGDPNIKDCNGFTPTDLSVILHRPIEYLILLKLYGGKLQINLI
jgi:ankyrin repeat protein